MKRYSLPFKLGMTPGRNGSAPDSHALNGSAPDSHARNGSAPDTHARNGSAPDSNGHRELARGTRVRPLLSVVVPTRNEADNVAELVRRLELANLGVPFEIIFVDDSDDGTPAAVEEAGGRSKHSIRLIHRSPDERADGLGGAVVEGFRAARGPWVCVMDSDLQHPPELVRELLDHAQTSGLDLVLASRFRGKGGAKTLGPARQAVSRTLIGLTRVFFPFRLRGVTDPLTGFFVVRRDALELDRLQPRGFKILLEILARTPKLRAGEVPFEFGERYAGESKASVGEGLTFLMQLWGLRFGGKSQRFGKFATVGISGLAVNMALLAALTEIGGMYFLLSAALATQGSTLWNFVLTERWVFRDRENRWGGVPRVAMYFLMNNAAFALRGPMLFVLVSSLGMHYLLANLISLATLTVIRYAVADAWIWKERSRARSISTYGYSIHDLVTVDSEVRLPELEPFRVDQPIRMPTIRVRIGRLSRDQSQLVRMLAFFAKHIRYEEGLGRFGFAIELAIGKHVEVVASPLLKRSPHVLYTNVVEPILRWTFVQKGYALVHGACIASGEDAFLITARTDTGKTTTILKTLSNHPHTFISDDLTLISAEGRVLTYPKPLTISRHTLKAVKTNLLNRRERLALLFQSRVHSRSGRRFAFQLSETRLPIATINALVQMLIPPPKYPIQRLVPNVHVGNEARIAGLVIIQRGDDREAVIDQDEGLDILMSNCEDAYGFPPYDAIESFLNSRSKKDLYEMERAIVASALTDLPAVVLGSSTMDWWMRLLPLMDAMVPRHLAAEVQTGAVSSTLV
jgi:dolichol-phosphate mannosyltransferase